MATNGSTIKIRWESFHLPERRSNVTFPMEPFLMLFKCQAINSFALGVLLPPCTLLCYDTYHGGSHYWLAFSLLCTTLSLMRDCVLSLHCLRFLAQNRRFMFICLLCWVKKQKFRSQVPWLVRKWNTFVLRSFWWFLDSTLWGKFWMLIFKWARPDKRHVGRQCWDLRGASDVPLPPSLQPWCQIIPAAPKLSPPLVSLVIKKLSFFLSLRINWS